jgi:prephenate dehydrogenase
VPKKTKSRRFGRVAIFGVGLIGGSFALALKEAGAVGEVVGVDRNAVNLRRALELGVIDREESDSAKAVSGAELVLLAMPLGQMRSVIEHIGTHIGDDTVLTDTGSTKQDVVRLACELLPQLLGRFVPAHPIAGAEHSGVTAARADLFREHNVVITPLAETSAASIARVHEAWTACGAHTCQMSAAFHDRVLAAVSHLPHLLAFALVEDLAGRADAEEFFRFAGTGFRDFTRIASSSPEIWRDVCLSNRAALVSELESYQEQLGTLRNLLLAGDADALEALFARARDARSAWLARNKPVNSRNDS